MTREESLARVTVDPKVCTGKPCIRGTRIHILMICFWKSCILSGFECNVRDEITADENGVFRPMPDRRELDNIIFDALGLTQGERDAVYEAVIELVRQRLEKERAGELSLKLVTPAKPGIQKKQKTGFRVKHRMTKKLGFRKQRVSR